MVGYP